MKTGYPGFVYVCDGGTGASRHAEDAGMSDEIAYG